MDTRGKEPKRYRVLKVPNPNKEDHWHWSFRYIWPRWNKVNTIYKNIPPWVEVEEALEEADAPEGGGILGSGRVIYVGKGLHDTYRKDKSKLGLSKALVNSMFTYEEKNSADKMRTTWERAVQHIVIYIGQDISKELWTRTRMVVLEPTHSQDRIYRHMQKLQLRNTTHAKLRKSRNRVLE